MKTVVLGATRGMGREVARQLAERGDELFLLGRNQTDLERSAGDLVARCEGLRVGWGECDLEEPAGFASALEEAQEFLGQLDAVIVTAGLFASQEELEGDPDLALRLLTVNFANTVGFCEHARKLLLDGGGGTLCVFSSVAGERGRKPVILYGSSKAGLSRYLEGLDHKFHERGLHVLCVKPGFVKTGMTAGLKPPPFAGEPRQVAQDVVRAIDERKPVIYTPRMWQLVMLVIRLLPCTIMRKISF